jgi:hypothetical protein
MQQLERDGRLPNERLGQQLGPARAIKLPGARLYFLFGTAFPGGRAYQIHQEWPGWRKFKTLLRQHRQLRQHFVASDQVE